ncbi:hypothetical protein ABH15_07515 [Methanoculleus taiwanensis]|uniref:DUF1616 domain-containing protein n=1 Tax=Methanoculleus taiwanensis TaxID=1550565 RepID=A0A498H131_9EURY|nr:hypothetical protein [Methanoculleus taiwanensis]RXE56035.1 hypothetical protein ABH15_07515 [Methanoculleus taiwanensis]
MTRLSRSAALLILAGCVITATLVISSGFLLTVETVNLTITFGQGEEYYHLGPDNIGVLPTRVYTRNFTVTNEDVVPAENVEVVYEFTDPASGLITGSGSYRIGDLAPGEARTFIAEYRNPREKAYDLTVKCRWLRTIV